MLHSPVLASFADSMPLDVSRASNSMTSSINRTLCVTCYAMYDMYVLTHAQHRQSRTVAIIIDAGTMPSSLTGELSMDEATIVASFQLKGYAYV